MPRQLIGWSMAGSRLIIDVSTLIRSEGQATGISRVSYELSRWALKHRQDARLAAIDWVYDYGTFRILNPASAAGLLQKKVVIDTFLVPDRWRADKIRNPRVPANSAPLLYYVCATSQTCCCAAA